MRVFIDRRPFGRNRRGVAIEAANGMAKELGGMVRDGFGDVKWKALLRGCVGVECPVPVCSVVGCNLVDCQKGPVGPVCL